MCQGISKYRIGGGGGGGGGDIKQTYSAIFSAIIWEPYIHGIMLLSLPDSYVQAKGFRRLGV